MTTPLSTIEIAATAEHKHSIIWLHGLGADGHDFESIVPELRLSNAANIHFIFPNAPVQPVTINGGVPMRAWYDILAMSINHEVDIAGIYQTSVLISNLIQQEIDAGIASENILLAGFSQGGVLALHTGLTFASKLAGIVALSTYLPTLDDISNIGSDENKNITIFMGHGTEDGVVDIRSAQKAYQGLKTMDYVVEWQQYPMPHSLCQQEIDDIARFISGVLK